MLYFRASRTGADARITFYLGGALPAGATFYLDTLSFKQLSGPLVTSDIGNIIFNQTICGVKVWSLSELDQQDTFWHDGSTVRVYSAQNPAVMYSSVELARAVHVINTAGKDHLVFDHLALWGGGCHGIWICGNSHVTITHCDISHIGGCDQDGFGGPNRVRYGNGVEIWDNGHDITVENCHIWQIYDAAITNQGASDNAQYNLYFRRNTIEHCEMAYELWNRPSGSTMNNIYFQYNTCRNAESWSHAQRPDPLGVFLALSVSSARIPGHVYITNNVFDTAACAAIYPRPPRTDADRVVIDYNAYGQPADVPLVRWNVQYAASAAEFARYQADTGMDANSILSPSFQMNELVAVQGRAVLSGFLGDNATMGLSVELRCVGAGNNATRFARLGRDGTSMLDNVTPGTYDLTAQAEGWLSRVVRNVIVSGNPTVLADPIVLTGGDVNGDDAVSFEDFSILQNHYGQSGGANPLATAVAVGGCGPMGTLVLLLLGLGVGEFGGAGGTASKRRKRNPASASRGVSFFSV